MAQPFVIPTIYLAIDRMSKVQAKIAAGNAAIAVSATATAARMERSLKNVGEKAMGIGMAAGAIGTGLIIPLGLATNEAMKFEKEMTNIATLVDTNVENMGAMGDAVLKIAERMPVKLSDLTESLYQIRSAGVSATDAMNVLSESAKLSVAGLGTVKESADMVTSAINVFKRENLSAATAADVLFKTVAAGKTKVELLAPEFGKAALAASDVGVSFKELMAMTAAMTNTGVQTAEAQTAITQAMVSLNKRTSEMIDIQQKISGQRGITGQEFIQWAGGAVGAMKKIDDYATSHRLDLFKIYGRKEGALADIALTRNQFDKFVESYKKMSGAVEINDAFAKQQKTTAAQMQLMTNNVKVLAITVGAALLPALNTLLHLITAIVKPIAEFAKKHSTLTKIIVVSLGVIGLLALGVSAVSFAVATFTKAIWLVRGAMYAWNFIMGATTVLCANLGADVGALNLTMAETPAFVRGAAAAMSGFSGVMGALLTRLNLTVAGLALIIAYRKEIQSWANDNAVGMWYNAHTGNKDAVNESLKNIYEKDPSKARAYIKDHPNAYLSGIENDFDEIDRKKKLEGIYSSQQREMEDETIKQYDSRDVNHHFTIDLKSNGKTVQTMSSKDMIPSTTSTSNYGD